MSPENSPSLPRTREVFLGLFILGQVAFLVSSNVVGYLRDMRAELAQETKDVLETVVPGWVEEKGPSWDVTEKTYKATRWWAQLTGQSQSWSLFAPGVAKNEVFPAILLVWTDQLGTLPAELGPGEIPVPGGKILLSDNEPPDVRSYFRFGNFRLRKFEANFSLFLTDRDEESALQRYRRWNERIEEYFEEYQEHIRGYLRWRHDHWLAAHPDAEPPKQLILLMRRYHLLPPGQGDEILKGPFTVPVARWLPEGDVVERFNPQTGRFVKR
jgi:hypothetical protein